MLISYDGIQYWSKGKADILHDQMHGFSCDLKLRTPPEDTFLSSALKGHDITAQGSALG